MHDHITFDSAKGLYFVNSGTSILGTDTYMNIDGDDNLNLTADSKVKLTAPTIQIIGNTQESKS